MLLLACALLFITTADKTWALSHRRCGGNVSLEPAGHINLTLPGLFTDADRPHPMERESDGTSQLSVCIWTIDVPTGKTVLLKPEWSGSGSSVLVQCVLKEGNQTLESGRTAVLSGCDTNKAALTWAGDGPSSNVLHLTYYVQEDERNSSDGRVTHHPDRDLAGWTQTGTSFTSDAPIGGETVTGADGGRGHPCEGLESSSDPRCPSGGSTRERALQGLSVAASADRETLPLPEEKPNNEADTSGAAHLTDAPVTAREPTHPYFEPELNTNVESMLTRNDTRPTITETILSFHSTFLTHLLKHTSSPTPKQAFKHTTSQTDQSVSSAGVPLVTSSTKKLLSQTTGASDAIDVSQGVAVLGTAGDKTAHPWRSLRNTDRVNSDLSSSSTTSTPLTSSPEAPRHNSSRFTGYTAPTSVSESTSMSQGPGGAHSSTPHVADLSAAVSSTEASSIRPDTSQSDSSVPEATVQTTAVELSEKFETTEALDVFVSSSGGQTNAELSTESLTNFSYSTSSFVTPAGNIDAESTRRNLKNVDTSVNTISSSPDVGTDGGRTLYATEAPLTVKDEAQNTGTYTFHPTHTNINDNLPTKSPTPLLPSPSSHTLQTNSIEHQASVDLRSTAPPLETSHTSQPDGRPSLSTAAELSYKQQHNSETTTLKSLVSLTTTREEDEDRGDERLQWTLGSTTWQNPTVQPPERGVLQTTPPPNKESHSVLVASPATSTLTWSSAESPRFYIVPDQPVDVKVEYIELLLQIVVESKSAFAAGLEEETAAWVEPYLQRAPGFSRLMGVWSSGRTVQSLVLFRTSEALQWLSASGAASLLEQTGLAEALREGTAFRTSRITNITVGGLQGEVCGWLLQCPAGYKCRSRLGSANYSCSSVCHFDHCHHHGICTHHPGQPPVCRCLVGDDFWYMGRRCDVRMTRARLVGACLAVLVIIVTAIGGLALMAVRRYRAILIQAKVDQTRSSYRRFNHFDELSARFWLRSWAGSADSLDNPAFTRSNDLLHLRALDRPCCYHDDTLSLASTCPSHGTHINTIYPHSSQYGWRGSEMSMGDGVLDSGKASDLSVCSWPVEPIHWTPFPLLQQLAAHRTPTVRVSRPRSYCEGMELVDLGRSWTA